MRAAKVTPEVLPSAAGLPREPPPKGTAIYLPLRKAFSVDLLGELHPSTLLFLRKLASYWLGLLMDTESRDNPAMVLRYFR